MAGTRLQIVGAFVLFAVLAAPLAWQLTQVERVPLPTERIQRLSWSDSRFSGGQFEVALYPLQAHPTAKPLSSHGANVGYTTQHLQLNEAQRQTVQHAVELNDAQVIDDALKSLLPDTQSTRFSVFLLCSEADKTPVLTVGKHRHAWSSKCQVEEGDAVHSALEALLQDHVYPLELKAQTSMARRSLQYRVQFSVLKENPLTPWDVDFETLVQQYMRKLLHKFAAIANFTVETQVVQYARLAKEVTANVDGTVFYLDAEDLKQFKSVNDFLAASVLDDREQVLHFMAALPDASHSPLFIRSDRQQTSSKPNLATSFELPGWGIAVILNPHALSGKASANITAEKAVLVKERELQRTMGLFVSEFRTLLGAPGFVQRQRQENEASERASRGRIVFLPSPADGIADWELDVVMRDRFTQLMQTAIETLQSTVELVETLPELSVLERVQTRVETAVTTLESILCDLEHKNKETCLAVSDLQGLLALARQASELTDAAYYDHTMIRQLYFPQEQMLGVYAPLLAPLILPFVLGFVRELKRWKAKRAAKKAKLQ